VPYPPNPPESWIVIVRVDRHRAQGDVKIKKSIRVLLAKVGLDGHDRGVKIVARALRDDGIEVVYTGLHRRPQEVVEAALQEDVDAVAVSILSGAHLTLLPRIAALMRERGMDDVALVVGGVIPDEDLPALRALGVSEVVGQEATPDEVVAAVRRAVARRGVRAS
jgi:methylmalonyl-CoA mutase C-terminal domain/subunit